MLLAAGAGMWPEPLLRAVVGRAANAGAQSTPIGRREIVMGLDGMSRVADGGNDPFVDGHRAAAVIASAFFCRESQIDEPTQSAILALIETRLLRGSLFAPRPEEPADPALVDGLVEALDQGIGSLRGKGHSIIFTVLALKALREVPEAATPARIAGLRRMVQGLEPGPGPDDGASRVSSPDLADEQAFVRFVFEEYLAALELYLHGRGHHGFAGHVLTIGHALLDLSRMGYAAIARKGRKAYEQFLLEARRGADLGGRRVGSAGSESPGPLQRDYWVQELQRPADGIASSHLVKYPYSFYALLKDLSDEGLKQRVLKDIAHLTAVS